MPERCRRYGGNHDEVCRRLIRTRLTCSETPSTIICTRNDSGNVSPAWTPRRCPFLDACGSLSLVLVAPPTWTKKRARSCDWGPTIVNLTVFNTDGRGTDSAFRYPNVCNNRFSTEGYFGSLVLLLHRLRLRHLRPQMIPTGNNNRNMEHKQAKIR